MARKQSVGGWALVICLFDAAFAVGQGYEGQRARYLGGWKPVAQRVNYQAPGTGLVAQPQPQYGLPQLGGPASLQPGQTPLNANDLVQPNASLAQQPPGSDYSTGSNAQANNNAVLQNPNGSRDVLPARAPGPLSQPNMLQRGPTGSAALNNGATNFAGSQNLGQAPYAGNPGATSLNSGSDRLGRLAPNQVATSLPFVTGPPQRTGQYFTSAYNQPWVQLANYQNPVVAGPAAPGVSASNAVLPQQMNVYGFQTAAYGCAPQMPGPSFPASGAAVPSSAAPPTLPPNFTPGLYTPDNAGYTPLFSLGQENYNVLLGRGIIGQPTAYVPGQPLRNFLRYISP